VFNKPPAGGFCYAIYPSAQGFHRKPVVNKAIIFSTIIVLISACSNSVGRNIDADGVQQIHKGSTTRAELISLFGQPDTETPYPDGQQLLMWTYSEARAMDTTEGKTLTVQMKNGRVFSYVLSKS